MKVDGGGFVLLHAANSVDVFFVVAASLDRTVVSWASNFKDTSILINSHRRENK